MTIREAAWSVPPQAYLKASSGGTCRRARQIMYAARGEIQRLTGRTLDDQYFTPAALARLHDRAFERRRPSGMSCSTPAATSTSHIPGASCRWARSRCAGTCARSSSTRCPSCRWICRSWRSFRPADPTTATAQSCSSRREGFLPCSTQSASPSATTLRSCRPRACRSRQAAFWSTGCARPPGAAAGAARLR